MNRQRESAEQVSSGTLDQIAQCVERRFFGANVGVLWVWDTGRTMLYFEWNELTQEHDPVSKLTPGSNRVLVALGQGGLDAERDFRA